jgi:hypothetical protein
MSRKSSMAGGWTLNRSDTTATQGCCQVRYATNDVIVKMADSKERLEIDQRL